MLKYMCFLCFISFQVLSKVDYVAIIESNGIKYLSENNVESIEDHSELGPENVFFGHFEELNLSTQTPNFVTKSGKVFAFTINNDSDMLGEDYIPTEYYFQEIGKEVDALKFKSSTHLRSSLILSKTGEVWGVGKNSEGELGLGHNNPVSQFEKTSLSNIKDIQITDKAAYALSNTGEVWVSGSNLYGNLGIGNIGSLNNWQKSDINNVSELIINNIRYDNILARKTNGEYWYVGRNLFNMSGLEGTSKFWRKLGQEGKAVMGDFNTYIIDSNNVAWSSGYNSNGQRGIGSAYNPTYSKMETNTGEVIKFKKAHASYHRSYFIDEEDELWAVGIDTFGSLGVLGNQKVDKLTRTGGKNIKKISSSLFHSFYIDKNNDLYGTGYNAFYSLGVGDNNVTDVFVKSNLSNVKGIWSSGQGNSSFALTNDNKLYSIGRNKNGELGLGDTVDREEWTEITQAITFN